MQHGFRHPVLLFSLFVLPSSGLANAGKPGEDVVARWLASNAGLTTLKVEFTQTRRLVSLKNPIKQKGVLWLDHPTKRFRWQIGNPPKTIVIREGKELVIVRPKSRKFERRAVTDGAGTGWAVLARGFPRTMAEFRRKYRLREVNTRKDSIRIVTQPLDESARGVRLFTFVINPRDHHLQAMELVFRDGSTQELLFTSVSAKLPLPLALFAPDLTGFRLAKF